MNSIEEFQRGDVDYLLATDLVARGLDIPNVKTVINFSFPNEPKRYLHRIGRTARAGMHGISVTLCNDQERTEIKKLNRKLGHPITPYTLQQKTVQKMFEQVVSMDAMVKDLLIEEAGDKELQQGLMEARRAENLIKYRDEIQNRPKNVWLKNEKQK
jgi:ATP-dependent RNA helicase DDX27